MKALKIIRSIFVWLMVALAVFMMIFTIISASTFDRADRSLFGYKALMWLPAASSPRTFPPTPWPSAVPASPISATGRQNIKNHSHYVITELRLGNREVTL